LNRREFLTTAALGAAAHLEGAAPGRAAGLREATVVVRSGGLPNAERTAATVLVEEVRKRTGISLRTSTAWPEAGPVIAISSKPAPPGWQHPHPSRQSSGAERRPEGYRLCIEERRGSPVVWILGADPRGALFGVGRLLRELDCAPDELSLAPDLDIVTAPAYPIRGHQLGYRAQANSYDAWSPAQFEQYIRELTYFGANSVEGIPFQDERKTPVMKYPRREMNRALAEICYRYGLDYWVWLPAEFDLKQTAARDDLLRRCDELFEDCRELTGVFFPGGDPGHNPPELVLPFLEDLSHRLLAAHRKAHIWLSLQWFTPEQIDSVFAYLDRAAPAWFGGLVAGPSSPPPGATRERLPKQYRLRLYPDITHNKLCQYQVPEWDQACALTLGREAINPRPAEYAEIHNRFAGYSDGFISYSDGVHDDVNKTIWSARSWDPEIDVRDVLVQYARVYFTPSVAEEAADAILALEKNWRGPLANNGSVEGALAKWQDLERRAPDLAGNWRWQMCLLRANYDAYVRRRLIRETRLELEANKVLRQARELGADAAMTGAMKALARTNEQPTSPELRTRLNDLCARLYDSIGLQTSVPRYHAIGAERGAVLDFVDYPLNNRWWLEDEFAKIRAMNSEQDKRRRLLELANWEHPGPGSFYDDIGNIARSPHVVSCRQADSFNDPEPTFWWWDQGKSRARLSWQVTMWPAAMVYEGLAPNGEYVVRSTGYGRAILRINGELVEPSIDGKEMGEFKEFPVAAKHVAGGRLVLSWERPPGEEKLNWRNRSRLAEVWLLRKS
jgi:hypothetical protein